VLHGPLAAADTAGGVAAGLVLGLAIAWLVAVVALEQPGLHLRRNVQRSTILPALLRPCPRAPSSTPWRSRSVPLVTIAFPSSTRNEYTPLFSGSDASATSNVSEPDAPRGQPRMRSAPGRSTMRIMK
jgi:hypothetical protein